MSQTVAKLAITLGEQTTHNTNAATSSAHGPIQQGFGLSLDVSVSTSRSRDVPTSRLGLGRQMCQSRLGLGHLHLVQCPRRIFAPIVQATLIKRVNFGRHGNASLSQLHQLVRSAFTHNSVL